MVADGGGDGFLQVEGWQGGHFWRIIVVGGAFAADAAIGRIRSPMVFFFFNPPHFPRKSTASGWMARSRSMMVAALAIPSQS